MMNAIFAVLIKRPKRLGALAGSFGCMFALFICTTALPIQTRTIAHEKPDWDDRIVPGSQLTVLDLTRQVIPDIKRESGNSNKIMGTDLSGIRLLDGVEETGMELDPNSGEECEVTESDYLWLKNGDDRFLVLLLGLDLNKLVIALFKTSPKVVLLDAVTIAQDVHVGVDTAKLWQIHPQLEAFTAHSWHDNSSESFDQYTFISVIYGKLRAIAHPASLQGFTEYSAARRRICKTAMSPKFRFVRSPRSEYFDLIVSETTLKVCHPESEEWSWKTGVVSRKSFLSLWRWNPNKKRYQRGSRRR